MFFSLNLFSFNSIRASDFILQIITFYTCAIAFFLVKNLFLITKVCTHIKKKLENVNRNKEKRNTISPSREFI